MAGAGLEPPQLLPPASSRRCTSASHSTSAWLPSLLVSARQSSIPRIFRISRSQLRHPMFEAGGQRRCATKWCAHSTRLARFSACKIEAHRDPTTRQHTRTHAPGRLHGSQPALNRGPAQHGPPATHGAGPRGSPCHPRVFRVAGLPAMPDLVTCRTSPARGPAAGAGPLVTCPWRSTLSQLLVCCGRVWLSCAPAKDITVSPGPPGPYPSPGP